MTVASARAPMAVLIDVIASFAAAALFVALFTRGDGTAPSLAAVSVAVVLSFVLSRWLQEADFDEDTMRRIAVAATFAGVALIAHFEYGGWTPSPRWLGGFLDAPLRTLEDHGDVALGVIALFAVWVRGLVRGRSEIEEEDVMSSVSVGLLAVIGAALIAPEVAGPAPWAALAVAFAALAFITLALYRTVEQDMALARFAMRWAPAMAGVAGMALLIGAAAVAVQRGAWAPASDVLELAGDAVAAVLVFVLTPVFWLLAQVLRPVAWLIDQIPFRELERREEEAAQEEEPPRERDGSTPIWLRVLQILAVGGITATVIAIAMAIVWFAMRRFARRQPAVQERRGAVEPAPGPGELGELLSSFRRLFRRRGRAGSAVAIRRLYFEVLDAAEERGPPRPPAATPMQFAPELDERFHSRVPSMISEVFVESRYGEHPVDDALVRDLRARWSDAARREPDG